MPTILKVSSVLFIFFVVVIAMMTRFIGFAPGGIVIRIPQKSEDRLCSRLAEIAVTIHGVRTGSEYVCQ